MSVALGLEFVKRFLFVLEEIPDLCLKHRSLPTFFRPNQRSQWSTPESGPLAHTKSAISPVFRLNQRSQWSTPESGPLAHTKSCLFPGFPAKSMEPVVHSGKWTTGWHVIEAFHWFPAKSTEPVVHSGEWTTSSCEIGNFPPFPVKSKILCKNM